MMGFNMKDKTLELSPAHCETLVKEFHQAERPMLPCLLYYEIHLFLLVILQF